MGSLTVDFPTTTILGRVFLNGTSLYAYLTVDGVAVWYPIFNNLSGVVGFSQSFDSNQWTVNHQFGSPYYWYQIQDVNGNILTEAGRVESTDNNTTVFHFDTPCQGSVVMLSLSELNLATMNASLIAMGKVSMGDDGFIVNGTKILNISQANPEFYDAAAGIVNAVITSVTAQTTDPTALEKVRQMLNNVELAMRASSASTTDIQRIISALNSSGSLITYLISDKVSVSDIVNALNVNAANRPLSAAQGKYLNDILGHLIDSLAIVATSGSYNDLKDIPDFPVIDWNATTGQGVIQNKPSKLSQFSNDKNFVSDIQVKALIDALAAVSKSGSYTDLSNTPTIPTKLSQLTDDLNITNYQGTVYKVNGQTGEITLTTDNIPEGLTNHYFSPVLVQNAINTADVTHLVYTSGKFDLAPSGVQAGRYTAFTTDTYGRVIEGDVLNYTDVVDALGFLPYSVTNPANYITASQAPVQSVAGRTGAVTLTVNDVANAVSSTLVGAPNGLATLGANGYLSTPQIPPSLLGGMNYQGKWDASTNTPTLTSGVGTKGFVYRVSVSGTTDLDGDASWQSGDFAIFNGTTWDHFDGGSVEVRSVAGRVGDVILTSTDIAEGTNLYFTNARAQAAISSANAGRVVYSSGTIDLAKTTVTAGTFNGAITVDAYGRVTAAANLSASDITSALGFNPVQQGGGTNQTNNKVYIGWSNTVLGLQVDSTNYGGNWPISITGTATYLSTTQQANTILGASKSMAMAVSDGSPGSFTCRATGTGDANLAGITFYNDAYAIKLGIRADGYFGLGGWSRAAWSLYSDPSGNLVAAGNVSAYSDPRLKKDIEKIKRPFDILNEIEGFFFTWNNRSKLIANKTGKRDIGFMSTDVKKTLPMAVASSIKDDVTGEVYEVVAYEKMVPVLTEAIKQLKAEVDQLKKERSFFWNLRVWLEKLFK